MRDRIAIGTKWSTQMYSVLNIDYELDYVFLEL